MKVVVILLSILVIIVCLVLGYLIGNTATQNNSAATPPLTFHPTQTSQGAGVPQIPSASRNAPLPSNPNQHNLIFIQADDLTRVKPRLESIWLVGYLPGSARVTVIMVYPAPPGTNSPKANALSDTFSVTNDHKPGDTFVTALRAYGFQVDGYFLTDNQGTAQLVDWLGGITMGDGQGVEDGPAVLTRLTPPWEDLQSSRLSQQHLTEGICGKLDQMNLKTNWLPLVMGLIPEHLYTDLSLEMASTEWKQLASGPDQLSCKVAVP